MEKIKLVDISENELAIINDKVKKANELIKSHKLSNLSYANKRMEEIVRKYNA